MVNNCTRFHWKPLTPSEVIIHKPLEDGWMVRQIDRQLNNFLRQLHKTSPLCVVGYEYLPYNPLSCDFDEIPVYFLTLLSSLVTIPIMVSRRKTSLFSLQLIRSSMSLPVNTVWQDWSLNAGAHVGLDAILQLYQWSELTGGVWSSEKEPR